MKAIEKLLLLSNIKDCATAAEHFCSINSNSGNVVFFTREPLSGNLFKIEKIKGVLKMQKNINGKLNKFNEIEGDCQKIEKIKGFLMPKDKIKGKMK